jgi:hypothetical protein
MSTVIEPVRADDRAAMDGWFDLTLRCQAHDAPDPRLSRRRHALRVTDWELDLTRGQAGTTAAISAMASGP